MALRLEISCERVHLMKCSYAVCIPGAHLMGCDLIHVLRKDQSMILYKWGKGSHRTLLVIHQKLPKMTLFNKVPLNIQNR